MVRPQRVIADLRELDRLTGGPDGARRVCWTPLWEEARAFLRGRLGELDGVAVEIDEAGNLWATLPGELDEAVAFGSHIDSVPNGGWLDGALGVMAALEVLRAASDEGRSRRAVAADVPVLGLCFGGQTLALALGGGLFGSSAVAGTLQPDAVRDLTDADGRAIGEVLAKHGVDLDRAPEAAPRRDGLVAYLELHIEQGPVLESEGVAVAAVTGTFGVGRHRFTFTGRRHTRARPQWRCAATRASRRRGPPWRSTGSPASTAAWDDRRAAARAGHPDRYARQGRAGRGPPACGGGAPVRDAGSREGVGPRGRGKAFSIARWKGKAPYPGRRGGGTAARDLAHRAHSLRCRPGRKGPRGRRHRAHAGQRRAP